MGERIAKEKGRQAKNRGSSQRSGGGLISSQTKGAEKRKHGDT